MTESELAEKVLIRLSPFFHIEREVWGKNSLGEKFRIDAVIRPKEANLWANNKVAFGIEFKALEIPCSPKGIAELIKQAYSYTTANWSNYGKMSILLCPPISTGNNEVDFYIKRILNSFNIGELSSKQFDGDLSIVFNTENRIWSEKNGVMQGKIQKFKIN